MLICLLAAGSVHAQAAEFNHDIWDGLLKRHVITLGQGEVTQMDYAGMAAERTQFASYLASLSAVRKDSFEAWPKDEQLAFLINAYNAWTVDLILTAYPDIESIKELGSLFESPWKKAFIPLLGSTLSLDDIEHGLIRAEGRYQNPYIHFAVNCASIGCPPLLAEAYTAGRLTAQLQASADNFLRDRDRNRLEGNTLYVSSIFKWYREDFERGWGGYHALTEFLVEHRKGLGLSGDDVSRLRAGEIDIEYLDYNWQLNRKSSS
ncbi:MAG: DUF547 domain-containing protein [Mariprofundaceae bacterium]|nr:DUF547 domain-containing protein [Mariprofundaceae bacterium]